jgi:hypothetical protein
LVYTKVIDEFILAEFLLTENRNISPNPALNKKTGLQENKFLGSPAVKKKKDP